MAIVWADTYSQRANRANSDTASILHEHHCCGNTSTTDLAHLLVVLSHLVSYSAPHPNVAQYVLQTVTPTTKTAHKN